MARKFKANESYFGALRPFVQLCRNFQRQPRRVEKSAPGELVVKRTPDLAPPPDQPVYFFASSRVYSVVKHCSRLSSSKRISSMSAINGSGGGISSRHSFRYFHLRKRDEAGKSSGHSSVQKFSIQRFRVKIFAVSHPDFPSLFGVIEIAAVSGGPTSLIRPKPYSRLREGGAPCSEGHDWSF